MKKILMIAYNFPPDSRSGIYRIMHFANYLAERGNYKPYVLTVDDHYYDEEFHRDNDLLKSVSKGVMVTRTKCVHLREVVVRGSLDMDIKKNAIAHDGKLRPKASEQDNASCNTKIWQKIKNVVTDGILSFPDRQTGWLPFAVRQGMRVIHREKIDIILATGSPWTSLLVGSFLSRLAGIPLVLDFRDPWIGNPFHSPNTIRVVHGFSRMLERTIVKKASAVILNTDLLRKSFINRYGEKDKFCVLHNGYLERELGLTVEHRRRKSNEFIFIHTGGLYGTRSVENFVIAFKKSIHRNVFGKRIAKLYLLGSNSEITEKCLSILGKQIFQKHCVLSERIPHEKCIKHLRTSHCFLVFQQDTRVQVPRKLFEYLALRSPIFAITPQDGETARIINQNNAGIVVQDNIASITDAIENIYSNYPQHYNQLQKNDDYKKYEMGALVVTLEKILDSILKDGVLNFPEIQH